MKNIDNLNSSCKEPAMDLYTQAKLGAPYIAILDTRIKLLNQNLQTYHVDKKVINATFD